MAPFPKQKAQPDQIYPMLPALTSH